MEAEAVSNGRADCCTAAIACKHCGEPTTSGDFCCVGCEAAHSASHSATTFTAFSSIAHKQDNGDFRLELSVEGIHCAACIRLIENAVAAQEGITHVRVNMTTERLSYSWQGPVELGDIIAASVVKLGYKLHAPGNDEADNSSSAQEKALLKAIAVAGFAAGNLMLISVGLWTTTTETMGMATRDFFHWVSALIALPTVIYSGRPFFKSALSVLKEGHTNMDVPISLAVILASIMSVSEALRHGEHVYFDSAAMLLFFLLIGRYLDARAKGKARESASKLLSKLAGTAAVLEDGQLQRVPIRELKSGMTVVVAAGETIPADGKITKGESDVDLSLISGETLPEHAAKGGEVFAGTLNLTGPLEIAVTKASENSLLSEIVRMMEVAEQGAAKYVRLADRAASLYTPVVHLFGALTFAGWWLLGAEWQVALLHAVTVLIITCPCALGLAVPVVQVLASGKLLKNGVLLKSGDALERLSGIDTVVFDKTGTLTIGRPALLGGDYSEEMMRLAASLAVHSRHPLSKALSEAYEGTLIDISVSEVPGKGLKCIHDGDTVKIGSRKWCGPRHIEDTGTSALELWLSVNDDPKAHFTFADQLRADAFHVVEALQRAGINTHLLSGDRAIVANEVAKKLSISTVQAEVTPTEKCEYLNALKVSGSKVLMVGDGLNDAPALAAADASMSPSSAIDITQNTADIVFQGDKLSPVYDTLVTARRSTALVRQNFALAILYNIIAVPLAVLGYVTPMIAAAAMSGSSLVVILNAFRLRSKRALS
ncbi:MAG: copper-translocating P-type ATPase [Kordiimonas sp.]